MVPAVGATVEIEVKSTMDYVVDEYVRYRGFLYSSANQIPAEFKVNYPFRKGFKFKSGIFMFDDTTGQEFIQLLHSLGHGFELTKDGDFNVTVVKDLLFTVLNDFIVNVSKKINLSSSDQMELTSTLKATIHSAIKLVLSGPQVQIGSESANEPLVLGNQLFSYLQSIITYLNTHAHSGVTTGTGSSGPPSSAPPVPPAILSTKISGE